MMFIIASLIPILVLCVCIRCINRNVRESMRKIELLQLRQLIQNEQDEKVKQNYLKQIDYLTCFKESVWVENLLGVIILLLLIIVIVTMTL